MKLPKTSVLILIAAFLFILSIAPNAVMATTELIVEQNTTNTSYFSRIQDAITYVQNITSSQTATTESFSILVKPGKYFGPIALLSNVPIRGIETARTFIDGGSGTLFTATNVSNVTISNLTIINASTGIASSNSTLYIFSSVFLNNGTAIQLQNSVSSTIANNTFYNNTLAISRDSDVVITNNIFSTNSTAINNLGQVVTSNISYNCYHNNTNNGITTLDANSFPNTLIQNPDPLFADPTNGVLPDFHLRAGSPCIGGGNNSHRNSFNAASDMGAFGGENADTIPLQVSGVTADLASATSISVGWHANLSYLVGGYKVYYGRVSGVYDGTGATDGVSPITVPTGTSSTSYLLSGLSISVTTPDVPAQPQSSPLNESLLLTWNAVPGATGYNVYADTTSPPTTFKDTTNQTSDTLTGLTNGQHYFVAVSAYSQALYYIAVTAVNVSSSTTTSNESAYSAETTAGSGDQMESGHSTPVEDYPEAIVAYPNLPDGHKGCFIATAAFGYYGAPEVQALRLFRDRYLETNALGNAFVAWYYRISPSAAAYLNAHPVYKPVVRAALMPAIGVAIFLTRTSLVVQLTLFLSIVCILLFVRKRSLSRAGGIR